MKKIVYFFLFIFLVSFSLLSLVLFGPTNAKAAVSDYDYQVVEKSPDATIVAGDSIVLWTKIKNTGNAVWMGRGDNAIHLGTALPRDRYSDFYNSRNWVSQNRVHWTSPGEYGNGDIVEFGFFVDGGYPVNVGNHKECFYPVVENISWMENEAICWNINVIPPAFDAEPEIDNNTLELYLDAGEISEVSFKVKNTGSNTWYNYGDSPIHLATYQPQDSESDFYHDSWINYNRPTTLVENNVRPGEFGTFKFTIQAPLEPIHGIGGNRYVENFWLVAENKQWFPNPYYPSEISLLTVVVGTHTGEHDYSEQNSSLVVDKEEISPNGYDQAKIEVYLKDEENKAISHSPITLKVMEYNRESRIFNEYEYLLITDADGYISKTFTADGFIDFAVTFQYKDYTEYSDWQYFTSGDKLPRVA